MALINLDLYVAAHTQYGGGGIGLRGTLTMNGTNYVLDNQIVGTSAAEALTAGDVTGAAALQFYRNTDPANFVTLYADGATGTVAIAKLLPGQWAAFWGGATPAIGAKANTAAVEVEKVILENVAITSLVAYRPKAPALDNLVAGISLQVVLNSLGVNLAHEYTEAAVSAGLLAVDTIESYAALWPSGAGLIGGTGYGTLVCLNPSAVSAEDTSITGTDSGSAFGRLYNGNGFAVIPVNGTSVPYSLADASHTESRLITRKTL